MTGPNREPEKSPRAGDDCRSKWLAAFRPARTPTTRCWTRQNLVMGGIAGLLVIGLVGFAAIDCSADPLAQPRCVAPMSVPKVLGQPAMLIVSLRGENTDLVHINIQTGSDRNLTQDSAIESSPTWSRDGKRIAFAAAEGSVSHIYTIAADGSDRQQLTHEDLWDRVPAFSPDGQKIAFCRRTGRGETSLYVMNAADGGNLKLLQKDAYDPAWSPDGSQIAFVSLRNGPAYHLFVMQADGSQVQELAFADVGRECAYPNWSPDGKQIAFTDVSGRQDWEIYVIDVAGTSLKQLTRLTGINTYPAWSPDGRQIAFRHHDRDRLPGPIFVMNADGSNQTIISAIADEPFHEGGRLVWKPE